MKGYYSRNKGTIQYSAASIDCDRWYAVSLCFVTCSVTSSLRLSRYCSLYFLKLHIQIKINYMFSLIIDHWSSQISDGNLMEISCNHVSHNSFGIRSCDCKIHICQGFLNIYKLDLPRILGCSYIGLDK